jgi:hypothetical protein
MFHYNFCLQHFHADKYLLSYAQTTQNVRQKACRPLCKVSIIVGHCQIELLSSHSGLKRVNLNLSAKKIFAKKSPVTNFIITSSVALKLL